MWPKIKNRGSGRVTASLQHHHLLGQLRRQATKNYLINIKITTIHTSVRFTVHDAGRKTSKRSKVPERKYLTRKERGMRKVSLEGRQTWGHTGTGSMGVRGGLVNCLVKPGLRLLQSFPMELAFQAKSFHGGQRQYCWCPGEGFSCATLYNALSPSSQPGKKKVFLYS